MKCELCRQDIQETFLRKMLGTVIKDAKGKKHYLCQSCQRESQDKQKILARL
ncbi:MAG TPA: hypothetical protein VJC16_02180 [Candidatus Nanoarchaeia archaeon]|nr:hypothetical protein [Candidatus Nanoarchaeia archaeon]